MGGSILDNSNVHFSGQSHMSKGYSYLEDWLTGGFVLDRALTAETNPASKLSTIADAGEWLVTITDTDSGAGTTLVIMDDEPGGVLRITTEDNTADVVNMQLNGTAFVLQANPSKRLFYNTRIRLADVDTTNWFVGLASADTAVLGGVVERVGFQIDASTAKQEIECVTEDASTETNNDTGVSVADAVWVELGFEWIPRTLTTGLLKFQVNGVTVVEVTTDIPIGDDMTPTIEVDNATAADSLFDCDWIEIVAERP